MTVVIGISCDDGIVLASDSQMSSGYTQNPETKIWCGDDGSFAFGAAGAEAAFQRLRDAFKTLPLAGKSVRDVRALLQAAAHAELSTAYSGINGMGIPANPDVHGAWAILGIFADGSPWLFKVDSLARVTDHNTRRFVSIGSGGPLAEHAVTVFRTIRDNPGFKCFHSQVLAFRVIQDAMAIGGPGAAIGGAVQVAVVSPTNGASTAVVLQPDDEALRDQVSNWSALEADSFIAQAPGEPTE